MKDLKTKIVDIVTRYVRENPKEVQLMKEHMAQVRSELKDEKFATAYSEVGGDVVLDRVLFEIPETLFKMFLVELSSAEQEDLKTKEVSRWFAKRFDLFRVPKEV